MCAIETLLQLAGPFHRHAVDRPIVADAPGRPLQQGRGRDVRVPLTDERQIVAGQACMPEPDA